MTVKKITAVLLVDDIEPCVRFWKERLGFEVAIEVPEGNKIGFVSRAKGGSRVDVSELCQRRER